MRHLLFIYLIFFLDLSANAQFSPQVITDLGNSTLEKTNSTGAYISIIQSDTVIFSKAFGYNNAKTKTILNDTTLFPISSNTKAFNAILLSQLVEAGQLDFEEPLKTYLPDLQLKNDFISKELTLLDLLTHRWGIPRYDFTYFLLNKAEASNPNKAVFNKLKYLESSSSFRTRFQYGNNQYILAAYLLEQLTGDSWEQQLKKKILTPLAMNKTHCNLDSYKQEKNKSIGYQHKKPVDIDIVSALYQVSGMGNMFSTIKDLEKWCKFLLKGQDSILSKKMITLNTSGHFSVGYEEPFEGFSSLQYGLGWYIFDYYGHKVALHHGDNIGHQSLILLLPDDNIAWMMVVNEGMRPNSFPFRMSFSLLDLMLGNEYNDWNYLLERPETVFYNYPDSLASPNTKPSLALPKYSGEYIHEGFGSIKIQCKKGQLLLEAGSYKDSLTHWADDTFRAQAEAFGEDYIFRFLLDEQSQVISLSTDLIEPSLGQIIFKKK